MKQTLTHSTWFCLLVIAAGLIATPGLPAQEPTAPPSRPGIVFNEVADKALQVMKERAEELKIKGAGVIAYMEGGSVSAWNSRMVVVGSHKAGVSTNNPGINLIAIAYSKAAEMADTLKDSGSGARPPMKGEFGWQGGLIRKTASGYVLASFSGGPSEDDLKVARAGLDVLAPRLQAGAAPIR